MILKRMAILFVVVLIAAACGGTSATEDNAGADNVGAPAPTSTLASVSGDQAADDHDDAADDHDDGADDHDDGADDHDDGADDHDDGAAVAADRTVEIEMNEWSFQPADISVTAGETVEFLVTNTGVAEHEFRLTTEHAALEHLAGGHEGHDDDAEATGDEHGEVSLIVQAGETGSVTVVFDEHVDFDQLACLLPGHYESGMYTPFTIEG